MLLMTAFAIPIISFADSPSGYTDVSNSNPYSIYINDLQQKGAAAGIGNGQFGPTQTLTRAEFTVFLVKTFQLPIDKSHFHFSDLDGHWAAAFIQTAWDHGITTGVADYTFDPDSPVTREEAATMVWRYLKSKGISPSVQNFMLPNTIDSWAREGIAQCMAKKLFGIPFQSGSFKDAMTRQEAAALLDTSLKSLDPAN